MKRLVYYFLSFILIGTTFTACTLEGDSFDQALLIGKWVSGTVHYRYDNGGGGATWDTSEDVQEVDAQEFTWTLVSAELTHIHILETGGAGVPKTYTVTKLTDTSLEYEDSFGTSYSFTKE